MSAQDERLIGVFVDTGMVCAEEGVLPTALDSLYARLRSVADSECDPPGLDGLCPCCGRKLAEPVGWDKHGCNPLSLVVIPAARLRRLVVRCGRLGRLMWAAARARRAAR